MIQPEAIGRGGGGGGERRGGGGYPAKVLRPTGLRASPNRASTRGQSKILEQGGRKDLKEVILVLPSPKILEQGGRKDLKEVILVLPSPRILQKIRPFDPMSGLNTTSLRSP